MTLSNYMTRDFVAVGPGDSLDKAIALMEEFNVHHLPVLRDGVLEGMVSDRDILLSTGWHLSNDRTIPTIDGGVVVGPARIEQIMSRPVHSVLAEQSVRHAAGQMLQQKVGAMPVMNNERMIGIVTESDLLSALRAGRADNTPIRRFVDQPVSKIMTSHVTSVEPRTPLTEVMRVFRDRHVRHVPVIVENELVGVISDRDTRRALGESTVFDARAEERGEFYLGPQCASEIMTREPHTITSSARLAEAIEALLSFRVHCLPVVDGRRLVGIITETDIVRAMIAEDVVS